MPAYVNNVPLKTRNLREKHRKSSRNLPLNFLSGMKVKVRKDEIKELDLEPAEKLQINS